MLVTRLKIVLVSYCLSLDKSIFGENFKLEALLQNVLWIREKHAIDINDSPNFIDIQHIDFIGHWENVIFMRLEMEDVTRKLKVWNI